MRHYFIPLILLFIFGVSNALVAPIYNSSPTITFYGNGSAPAVISTPRVCESVNINFQDSIGKAIQELRVTNDSLIITTVKDTSGTMLLKPSAAIIAPPISYGGTPFIFDQAGAYKAYEHFIITGPGPATDKYVGMFRIYPQFVTEPTLPLAGRPLQLQLVVGQTHTVCPPQFETVKAVVKSNDIFVSYTEVPFDGICSMIYLDPPLPYGPAVDLAPLSVGTYTVHIEDSIIIGTINVATSQTISGTAMIMQDPRINMVAKPVPGAKIVAEVYQPCTWLTPAIGQVCSTVTDTHGVFTMDLPESLLYDLTATKDGFYPQTVPLAVGSGNAYFEMLDTSQTAITDVNVAVVNGGAPLESAYVSLYAGHEPAICPALSAKASQTYFGGYTDQTGTISFKSAELTPFIDYAYDISIYIGKTYYYKNGMVRLYQAAGWQNMLTIDMGTTGIAGAPSIAREVFNFTVTPNPAGKDITIEFSDPGNSAELAIYDIAGKPVCDLKNIKTGRVVWGPEGRERGIYIVKLTVGSSSYFKKIFITR